MNRTADARNLYCRQIHH